MSSMDLFKATLLRHGLEYLDIKNKKSFKKIYDLFIHDILFDPIYELEMNYVAFYYECVKNDYEKMKQYFLMAIDQGYVIAMRNLAIYYEKTEKDKINAIKYFLMAIEKDHVESMFDLAHMFEKLDDKVNVEKYYLMAIDHGHINSMKRLAKYYRGLGNHRKTIKYFLMAIEKGNTSAMNQLALYYYNKCEDYKKAIKYFLMAIGKGNFNEIQVLISHYKEHKDYFGPLAIYRKNKNSIDRDKIVKYIKKIWNSENELNDKQKKIFVKTLMSLEFNVLDKMPWTLEIFINSLHEKIDVIDLHFNYAVNSDGFKKAQHDFIDKIVDPIVKSKE